MLFLYSIFRTLQHLYLSELPPDLSYRYYPNAVLCSKCVAGLWSLSPDFSVPTSLKSSQPRILLILFFVHYQTDSLADLSTEVISDFFLTLQGVTLCFSSTLLPLQATPSSTLTQRAHLPSTMWQAGASLDFAAQSPAAMSSNKAVPTLLTQLCRPPVMNPNLFI